MNIAPQTFSSQFLTKEHTFYHLRTYASQGYILLGTKFLPLFLLLTNFCIFIYLFWKNPKNLISTFMTLLGACSMQSTHWLVKLLGILISIVALSGLEIY